MKVKEIKSERNNTFKLFLKLTNSRGIKKHGLAFLSGPKQVREVLRDFPDKCGGIVFSDQHEPPLESAIEDIPFYRLAPSLFRQIDLFDTKQPVLLVRAGPFSRWPDGSRPHGCILCVPFQDPANVGAVIRSAAAFGVSMVVMLKEAAHPFLPKSVRVAGSALFRVPILEGPSLNKLDVSKMPVVTLSQEGKDIIDYRFPYSFCLVPGLEGPGLPNHLREATVLSISMEPGVESINAAIAAGIALYIWRNGLKRTGQI